jgi:hypothetical protein
MTVSEEVKAARGRPKSSSSLAQQELDKAQKQFDDYEQNINSLTLDRMNEAPKQDVEPQTKISQVDIAKSKDIYLKPKRSIASREKFNEKFRDQYNFAKEYVHFIAEHKEMPGETIRDMWTKPFPGMPAEEWDVPVNKPIWAPRYVAEQIKAAKYHALMMQDNMSTGSDKFGTYTGQMIVDKTVQRLDAIPVSERRSIFMGKSEFK